MQSRDTLSKHGIQASKKNKEGHLAALLRTISSSRSLRMNRTDRLVAMVMLLQSRRVITAAQLAEHFGITERTVYRDLSALGEAGVPVLGEAGVGYSLMHGYHLPPVMFSSDEAFALITGGLLAERMTDASMRDAARSALGKVTAVLPTELQNKIDRLRKAMLIRSSPPTEGEVPLSGVQIAVAEGRLLDIQYRGAAREHVTQRIIEPLGLVFYLDHWHIIAWCRLRDEIRDFRVDRIIKFEALTELSPAHPNFDLSEHLAKCMSPAIKHRAVLLVPNQLTESAQRHWGPMFIGIEEIDGMTKIQLAYDPSAAEYLKRWILGMAQQVQILEPLELKKQVAALAHQTMQHHQ